jgi:importin-5
LNQDEVNGISEKIIKLLLDSDQRKNENERFKHQEDIDDEEKELIDDDVDNEEELHVALAELIGVLFKTHKELTLGLVDLLYHKVLNTVLQPALSDKMHKFGLFLIDDMIEHLGIELIPDKWPVLSEALIRYACDKTCFVRQAAVYGKAFFFFLIK